MSELLIVMPSRERPDSIERVRTAMENTCVRDTQLVVGCDLDDPRLSDYLRQAQQPIVRDGMRQVVAWLNYLATATAAAVPYIGHFGDDNVPQTVGWDAAVIEALERKPFAFGDDGHPGRPAGSLCCHIFMRSSVIRALGYMGPPELRHQYVDNVWMAWGSAAGIDFLPDVAIPHLHPSAGVGAGDRSYEESAATMTEDGRAFECYMNERFADDVAKIRAA